MKGQEADTHQPFNAALRRVQDGSYIYVRLMDSGQVDGEKPGRLWFLAQVEQKSGSSWRTTRAGGTDLEQVLAKALAGGTVVEGGEPKRVVRRLRR